MNISNNVSSITAHQTLLNTSANNIANVNTDGFIPKDTRITDNAGSVRTNTREADNNGSKRSQTDLAKEIPNEIIAQDATAVNVNVIKTQDEMLGTLLDIKT
ncbi:flagellar basal body rod C-terminal domain-containing protein [Sulfurimonas sp.]